MQDITKLIDIHISEIQIELMEPLNQSRDHLDQTKDCQSLRSGIDRLSSDSVSISDCLTAMEQSLDGVPMAVAKCLDKIDAFSRQASQPEYSINVLSSTSNLPDTSVKTSVFLKRPFRRGLCQILK